MTEPKTRRAADALTMLVALEPDAKRPLHRQLYDGLRDAILEGRLAAGARLPSTRAFAADLGIARNTVLAAFDQLRTEGYIVGHRGGGTRVRRTLPDRLQSVRHASRAARRGATGAARAAGASPDLVAHQLSSRGVRLAVAGAGFGQPAGGAPVPFDLGVPALEHFPSRLWSRLAARQWRVGGAFLGDADAAGDAALRSAIAEYVVTARGAYCTADQVLVMNGTQQALDLAARVLLDTGDVAWLEDPGYAGARAVLEAAGARLCPVPVDHEGMDVAAAERAAPGARLAYVTPSHQFPLGAVMSAARRLALLTWAQRSGAWIIEDDYDSEFRYAGRPLPCLQGMEASQLGPGEQARVLYTGSFSKTLAPGLRLGYLVVPDQLVDGFRAARTVIDRNPATPAQAVLAEFIVEGHYARHLRRVRALYAERQAVLLAATEQQLEGLLTLAPDPAGLHLVGRLAPELIESAAAQAAAAHGVVATPLSRYALQPRVGTEPSALLLGYAGFDHARIRSGVLRLRRALDSCRCSTAPP